MADSIIRTVETESSENTSELYNVPPRLRRVLSVDESAELHRILSDPKLPTPALQNDFAHYRQADLENSEISG